MQSKIKYSIILVGVFLASTYVFVFYSHKYNRAFTLLPLMFLVVVFIFLSTMWSSKLKIDRLPLLLNRFIYGAAFACVCAGLVSWRGSYEQSQIHKYGVVVNGRVIDSQSEDGERGRISFYADIEYYYKNKTYRQRVGTSTYTYKYHDYLKVLCSSNDPEIFEIISVKSGLDIKY